jgi:hypothetical protein
MFGIETKRNLRVELAELRPQLVSTKIKLTQPEETMTEFAKKAESVLGYHRLNERHTLRNILLSLDIEIFDEVVVRKYMDVMLRLRKKESRHLIWQWTESRLSSYTLEVPEFVLNKAIQIKEKARELGISHGVELNVIHLTQFVPDPFLRVSHGDEKYFIEVWDEQKFEGRLQK